MTDNFDASQTAPACQQAALLTGAELDALVALHRGIAESHADSIRGPDSMGAHDHRATADALTALRAERDEWKRRAEAARREGRLEGLSDVTALVETAQWARNRLEAIADENWKGDARDFKRSLIGVFSDFDEALVKCGSVNALAARVEGETK